MIDEPQVVPGGDDDYVHFWNAGVAAKGEFHCSDCGYGVTVYRELPLCPMCGCSSWEEAAWSPFMRTANEPPEH